MGGGLAGRQADGEVGWWIGMQTGRWAVGQVGRQADRQAGRCAGAQVGRWARGQVGRMTHLS